MKVNKLPDFSENDKKMISFKLGKRTIERLKTLAEKSKGSSTDIIEFLINDCYKNEFKEAE